MAIFEAVWDRVLGRIGCSRRVMMTLPVLSGIRRAVAHSDLIASVPGQLADMIPEANGIGACRPPIDIEPVTIVMAWPRRSTTSPSHRWLRGLIATIMRPLDSHAGDRPICDEHAG